MDAVAAALDSLARTPDVLRALLEGLDDARAHGDEGPGTFSPHDVVGHLIHGEDTDWVPRIEHILTHGDSRPFEPFEREGFHELYATPPIDELLALFTTRRAGSLARVRELRLGARELERKGLHPELGAVTLGQLLETWVVHDLAHLAQVARVLARGHAEGLGPWRAYFRLLGGGG